MVRPRKLSDDDILDAAREVFVAHGPHVSTTVVAEAVGLSQAALFKRFGTKENLMVRALLPPPRVDWVDLLGEGPDQRPMHAQLLEIADAAMRFFDRMLPCLMTLKAAGLDLVDLVAAQPEPPPLMVRRALRRWFAAAMDQGRMRRGDPDALALAFMGAMQARAAFSHMFGAEPLTPELREAHVRGVVDALWSGLAPQSAPLAPAEET